MGVKFGREYEDIVNELAEAIQHIDGFYGFFDMNQSDWQSLESGEQAACAKTLADDVFFALGERPKLSLAEGQVTYEQNKHRLKVEYSDNVVTVISLI